MPATAPPDDLPDPSISLRTQGAGRAEARPGLEGAERQTGDEWPALGRASLGLGKESIEMPSTWRLRIRIGLPSFAPDASRLHGVLGSWSLVLVVVIEWEIR